LRGSSAGILFAIRGRYFALFRQQLARLEQLSLQINCFCH
jgi:hypothetical protein